MSTDMDDLLSIGEFAAASRLSQKALRLYGEKGLLQPAWVDPGSGYRYYSVAQLREATLIALLRRCGMALAGIRAFLRDPSVERLEAYERNATDELAERLGILRYVKRLLEEETMYEVLTKRVPEQAYVSRSKHVRVPELESYIRSTFEELGDPGDGRPFVLYHGAVNAEERRACRGLRAEDRRRQLPGGEVAFTEISGSQCEFPEILGAYEAIYRWAKEHDREAAGPAREIYLDGLGEHMHMEIALPLA